MASHQPTQPEPEDRWPACDQQPPGTSIRPLRHGDLPALLAHLDHHREHDQDEDLLAAQGGRRSAVGGPVVAVRVRASVGRPGASAHAEYRRRRATDWAAWSRGLPWRVAAALAAGVAAGLLAAQVTPRLDGLLAVAVAAGLGWRLRFRPSSDAGPGDAGRRGSGAPPACWLGWSGRDGWSCTTWPSRAPQPTLITWPSARVGCS